MKQGETAKWYHGKRNATEKRYSVVTLISKVSNGWIVKLQNGMQIGPITEDSYSGIA